MTVTFWLCAIMVVSVASGTSIDVPNQCPSVSGSIPTFYVHPDDCQSYFMCDNGTPVLMKCADGTRWSDVYKTCVGYNTLYDTCTRQNAERECRAGATVLIPHPTICQRYYNCSMTSPPDCTAFSGRYDEECPYPQVFDVNEKKCKSYKEGYCGAGRVGDKEPCNYVNNRCCRMCSLCPTRLPSCVGLADGTHEHPEWRWSPYHILCEDERLVLECTNCLIGLRYCMGHALTGTSSRFSPIKKACVSVWETPREYGGQAPSCDGKDPGQSYRIDDRPDIYYSCPGAEVSYCGLGNVFNESTQKCESSKQKRGT